MKIRDAFQKNENNELSVEGSIKYLPSSSEKKQAIMMYFFFGVIAGISKKEMSVFSYYHLKQASGWWILFIGTIILDAVLLLLPVIKYLGFIPLIVLVVVWVISIRDAWNGRYFIAKGESALSLFSGIGGWFIDLFDLKIDAKSVSSNLSIDSGSQITSPNSQVASTTSDGSDATDILSDSDIEKDIKQQ